MVWSPTSCSESHIFAACHSPSTLTPNYCRMFRSEPLISGLLLQSYYISMIVNRPVMCSVVTDNNVILQNLVKVSRSFSRACRCYAQLGLMPKLFHACVQYLKPVHLELPIGIINRLVIGDESFVEQFASTVHESRVCFSLSTRDFDLLRNTVNCFIFYLVS